MSLKFFVFFITMMMMALNVNTAIDRPAGCRAISHVISYLSYEKTFCYVTNKFSHFVAGRFCENRKMKLGSTKSSATADRAADDFAISVLGNDPDARVYVAKRVGNRCSLISGTGRAQEDWCTATYNFFCEYEWKPTTITCEEYSYNPSFGGSAPNSCKIVTTVIDNPQTSIAADPSVDGTTIFGLDFQNNKKMTYLPIDVASDFPNLRFYSASGGSVTKIYYENFKGLTTMQFLILEKNLIQTVTNEMLRDMTSLRFLHLGSNQIKELGVGVFSGFNSLISVILSGNVCVSQILGAAEAANIPSSVVQACRLK